VVAAAQKLERDFGERAVTELRGMPVDGAFEYLTNLPGVGPKSALCVMMYSLEIDVFPVDINVQRILSRMGLVPRKMKHYQAQQRIPKFVPQGRSKELHIGLVVHGRTICLPQRQRCSECCLVDLCQTGIRNTGRNRNGAAQN
jgi:endonuclease III